MERSVLKVLKGLAEHLEMSVGDLVEGISLHAFEGRTPFSEETLEKVRGLSQVYGLTLGAADAHAPEDAPASAAPALSSGDGEHARQQLTDTFHVNTPPEQAFTLFTARGEEAWVPGWTPTFPTATVDDTSVGTVFTTRAADRTAAWVVVASDPGRTIRYAQVVPGMRASLISVSLSETSGGGSEVTVSYDVTALSAAGDEHLTQFAHDYPEFLLGWQAAISAYLG